MNPQRPSTWRWARRVLTPAALALSLTLLLTVSLMFGLAACGGNAPSDDVATLGGDDGSTENTSDENPDAEVTEEERQQAMLDYARCMREHGVDMPDPTFGEDGQRGGLIIGGDRENMPDQATMEAAQDACQPLMEDVFGSGPMDLDPEEVAKRQEEALAFAKCMRDHGVDFPDPQFEGGGRATQSLTIDPTDPTFQAAQEACAPEGDGGPGFTVGGPGGSLATGSDAD
jgi:hypothetical protein